MATVDSSTAFSWAIIRGFTTYIFQGRKSAILWVNPTLWAWNENNFIPSQEQRLILWWMSTISQLTACTVPIYIIDPLLILIVHSSSSSFTPHIHISLRIFILHLSKIQSNLSPLLNMHPKDKKPSQESLRAKAGNLSPLLNMQPKDEKPSQESSRAKARNPCQLPITVIF